MNHLTNGKGEDLGHTVAAQRHDHPKLDQLQAAVPIADDDEFLRERIGFAAQRLMDLEVEAFTGAG